MELSNHTSNPKNQRWGINTTRKISGGLLERERHSQRAHFQNFRCKLKSTRWEKSAPRLHRSQSTNGTAPYPVEAGRCRGISPHKLEQVSEAVSQPRPGRVGGCQTRDESLCTGQWHNPFQQSKTELASRDLYRLCGAAFDSGRIIEAEQFMGGRGAIIAGRATLAQACT